ncbi:hypothetical protein RJ55_01150 [Drechmeria coniospora]|nr:hypothetical protein RJ55_01150 [Drechmeria coniospora]
MSETERDKGETGRAITTSILHSPSTSTLEQRHFPGDDARGGILAIEPAVSPSLEAVQGRSPWRNPWAEVTLADNYRVGGYNVDYAGQSSHTSGLSQLQHAYTSPVHQHNHHPQAAQPSQAQQQQTPYQAHHKQQTQNPYQHQHRNSVHHPGLSPVDAGTPPGQAHGHIPSRPVIGISQKQQQQQSQSQPQSQPQQPPSHKPQVPMDPSHLHNHRLGHVHFGTANSVSSPLYGAVSSPTQAAYSYSTPSAKRPRTDDFDLGVSVVDQSGIDSVQATSLGAAYDQAAAAAAAAAATTPDHGPQMHHHHHLPDLGPPAKSMRREDMGGAPSMVGQAGMPEPAPRPRGPKLKFTAEDDQLLIELKEQKNLTWKQIADFFPGRSSGTLQVRYCTKLKAKTTLWTEEMDDKLRKALQDYENEKWRIVAHKVGSGFTPAACRERAGQLSGDEPEQLWESMSPKAASLPDSMEMPQTQRPW